MKHWVLMMFACFIAGVTIAQTANPTMQEPYEKAFRQADSLMTDAGLPQSAVTIVQGIYSKAKAAGQEVQMLKAQLYLMRAASQYEEGADTANIHTAVGEAGNTVFPYNAVWHGIAAQLYLNYYEQHRWQILQRSTLRTASKQPIEEWDAAHFRRVITKHYDASIGDEGALERTDLREFGPLLTGNTATRYLRPTLFDLLAFRALAYYTNEEAGVTRPAYQFRINDPAYLSAPKAFINLAVSSKDTASQQLAALRLYQRVLDVHLNDPQPDALIDADLLRLKFVYDHATFPDKKAYYASALNRIANKYRDNPTAAEAGYRAIALQYETQAQSRSGTQPAKAPARDLQAIKTALEAIVARFPKSEGGINAQRLINDIVQPVLSIQSEEAVVPEEYSKVLVTYKNVPNVWLRVIKLSQADYDTLLDQQNQLRKYYLLGRKAVATTAFRLPTTDDFETHTTELPVAPLSKGIYAAMVYSNDQFSKMEGNISYVLFQVTDISMITRQGKAAGYVLNRKTGRPIAGAELDFFASEWKGGKYSRVKKANAVSKPDGSFDAKANQLSIDRTIIKSGDDVFYANAGIYAYEYNDGERSAIRTFFFTDRSIYRPGQTIYFKGIAVQTNGDASKTSVIANGTTKVTFTDANGQVIKTLILNRNEFGSFAGKFTAPATGLTGSMRISDEWGSANLSVEEYKRPRYEVSFDTLKGSYALNETVTITGAANAYAGNVIDGATVNYRVVRQAVWPYLWLYRRMILPQTEELEVANGTVETDAAGKFRISFATTPDETVDTALQPTFNYTLSADVTDAAGETRSATTTLRAGYKSIEIAAAIPTKAAPAELKKLSIGIQNLNGQALVQDANISIAPLIAPAKIFRARLWPMPDQYIIEEAIFRKNFPLDEYRNESKPEEWIVGPVGYQQVFTSNEQREVTIPANTYKSGWYVITIRAKDVRSGAFVEDRHFIEVTGGVPTSPLAVTVDKPFYEPGQTAKATVASGFGAAHILQQATYANSKTETAQRSFEGAALSWQKAVGEGDRGGISLQWLIVKDNRVYIASKTVSIPWSNKDLDISWATHRDKLEPGAKEKWTLTIRGNKKEKVAAELMAGMYDASLDALKPHEWEPNYLFGRTARNVSWNKENGFGIAYNQEVSSPGVPEVAAWNKEYESLVMDLNNIYSGRSAMRRKFAPETDMAALTTQAYQTRSGVTLSLGGARASNNQYVVDGVALADGSASFVNQPQGSVDQNTTGIPGQKEPVPQPPLRKNLQETAFFFPQLKTDPVGNVSFTFTLPEALTEWKFMALAHTQSMATGQLSGKVKTQKDLMVQPNLPRFLRQGDDMILTTKINNLSTSALSGTATLEIVDAQTLLPATKAFRIEQESVTFTAAMNQSTTASWRIHVPESRYEPVLIRISAQAGNFTDGEENLLPVLTNRTLVTETLPLWMNGTGTKTFTFDKLLHSKAQTTTDSLHNVPFLPEQGKAGMGATLSNHRLTVEYTSNPAWYAIQALPYLMEYPYECAEQTFNRYYANALAAHILDKAPRVKEIFAQWKSTDTAALQSNLQKNEELKSALLEETPWVLEAKDETQQKHNIALLFDSYKLGAAQEATLRKLDEVMMPEGAFPWFKGGSADRYITQYIATGLARLQHLGITSVKGSAILQKATAFLDRSIEADYKELLKAKVKTDDRAIGYTQIQYLYAKSFDAKSVGQSAAFSYYLKQAAKYWPSFNPYMKGMIALSLYRLGDQKTAQNVIQSLRETAIHKEEMGMYWMEPGAGYHWYEAPVEAQALLIECFSEVATDATATDELKRWLLKQKQTQNWSSTRATADACYALLLNGAQWLNYEPSVSFRLGDKTIAPAKAEAGTGYFKQAFAAGEITPAMGNINVTIIPGTNQQIDQSTNQPSYGAVYWQYFEDYDKITAAASPLSLRRQMFKERNTPTGPVLDELREGAALKLGDKVKVRIILKADRDMEYLHLKDTRAALFEPVNVLSGYRWQGGLGYYESTRDASSNFFISYLPKGSYVFEYTVNVMATGNCSNGIATAQCMYAPEFSSHSEGSRIVVD